MLFFPALSSLIFVRAGLVLTEMPGVSRWHRRGRELGMPPHGAPASRYMTKLGMLCQSRMFVVTAAKAKDAILAAPGALDRQGHKHEAYAAEDQNGCRQGFSMTFESRRSPLPVVTHTLSPQNPWSPYLTQGKKSNCPSGQHTCPWRYVDDYFWDDFRLETGRGAFCDRQDSVANAKQHGLSPPAGR